MTGFFSGFFLRTAFLVLAAAALPALGIVFFTAIERNSDALSDAEALAIETVDSFVMLQQSFALQATSLLRAIEATGGLGAEAESGLRQENPQGGLCPSTSAGTFFMAHAESLLIGEDAPEHESSRSSLGHAPSFVTGKNLCCTDDSTSCIFHGLRVPGHDGDIIIAKATDPETSGFIADKLLESPGATLRLMDMEGKYIMTLPYPEEGDRGELSAILKELEGRLGAQGSFYMGENEKRSFVSFKRLYWTETSRHPYAQVVLAIPADSILSKVEAVQRKDTLLLFIALGGVVFFSALIVYLLFYPSFRKMLAAARAYAAGNFEVRLSPDQPVREFGELAESMNSMAAAIEKHESDLIKARKLAEFSGKSKGEFLANMSHEIRTPMNAIIGMAYLTLKSDLTPRQRGYLSKIYDAASALLKVINDILELSKLDAGKLRIELVPFAMRDIVVEARRHVAIDAQEKGLELNFSIAPDIPRYLMGDPLHLSQVLGHLLENAVRLTRSGSVTLSCELVEMSAGTARVLLRVEDTGPGMSAERLQYLKRLFTGGEGAQAENPSDKTAGLGLLLVHRLLQAMNGKVELESKPGKGTSFHITIPFGQRPENSGRQETLLSGLRVLAVDDDWLTLETYKQLLASFGMDTVVHDKPEEVLTMLKEAEAAGKPFNLVVLDWRMPQMDGLELARRIRTDRALRYSPSLILFSAFGWEGLTLQAESAGVDAFLNKPINESVLLDTILTLLKPDAGQYYLRGGSLDGADSQDLKGISCLVVDDNAVNQDVARELLEDAGMTVTLADNGQKAFEAVRLMADKPGPPFDIVLMDVQMPVMNGLEACRNIRNLAAAWAGDLPVIAMTVHSRAADVSEFRQAGFDDHVAKPISVEELFACVKRWRPVSPVREPAVGARIRLLYDDLRRSDPAWHESFQAVEFMLGLHIHEGRLGKLAKMLEEGRTISAADYLDRLNATLGFK